MITLGPLDNTSGEKKAVGTHKMVPAHPKIGELFLSQQTPVGAITTLSSQSIWGYEEEIVNTMKLRRCSLLDEFSRTMPTWRLSNSGSAEVKIIPAFFHAMLNWYFKARWFRVLITDICLEQLASAKATCCNAKNQKPPTRTAKYCKYINH